MNVVTSDFECTTSNTGNPFDSKNKAVCLALKDNDEPSWCSFDPGKYEVKNYCTQPTGAWDLWVLFNAKFDLHWYRKLVYTLPQRVWCCQLAEFILDRQAKRFPSLEETAVKYGLGHKIDIVKTEYWEKGIDTDAIPQDVLSEYACQDVDLTYQVYLKQLAQFELRPGLYKLFKLLCLDLLVLEEMEWNGLVYDEQLCKQKELEIDHKIQAIQTKLAAIYPHLTINFNSGDQLSAFLYGGVIVEEYKEHIGFFKGGLKAGQPKFKNAIREHVLPRLVQPLKNSELKKEGYFSTDEATLRKLKGTKKTKQIIEWLLELSKLEKLNGTYYRGIPAINKEMNWASNKLHGQFNQVVAATGRLSSSKPNLQNFAGECEDILVSRFTE